MEEKTEENKKKDVTMLVVTINVIIMVVYTIIIRLTGGNDGALAVALLLAGHVISCLLIAPFIYSKGFLLSSLAVLLIGFSTCYLAYTLH